MWLRRVCRAVLGFAAFAILLAAGNRLLMRVVIAVLVGIFAAPQAFAGEGSD